MRFRSDGRLLRWIGVDCWCGGRRRKGVRDLCAGRRRGSEMEKRIREIRVGNGEGRARLWFDGRRKATGGGAERGSRGRIGVGFASVEECRGRS